MQLFPNNHVEYFPKIWISTPGFDTAKDNVEMFTNQEMNTTNKIHNQHGTFCEYTFFTEEKYFLSYGAICVINSQKDRPLPIWTFNLKNSKIRTSHFPSWHIILNPNWTKKAQKIPN